MHNDEESSRYALVGKTLGENTFHVWYNCYPEWHHLSPCGTTGTNKKEKTMTQTQKSPLTLEGVCQLARLAGPTGRRPWIGRSATERICAMAGMAPASLLAEAPRLRAVLSKIRPAAHGITAKTWANLLSRFRVELRLADVIDPNYSGYGARDPVWGPLVEAIAGDKRLSNGLASFCNWCAARGVTPDAATAAFEDFGTWLDQRTLCPRPRDVLRRVPQLWNEASDRIGIWPKAHLHLVSFKAPPTRHQWSDLRESLRLDAEVYCAMRENPDPFDERLNAPPRALAASTLRQQRLHIRLAASILIDSGIPAEEIASLADLVKPERFKTVLRHYHKRANKEPNAFVVGLAKTLIQVAWYHVGASREETDQLKAIARKLPPIPLELTPKNKALLRKFESDRLKAELLFLPEKLVAEVTRALGAGRVDFVKAQVAVAIDFQLVVPLRPQNLSRLNWQRHFIEPDGQRGGLLLHIPKEETKSRQQDFTVEIPDHVARRLRWYRRHILPSLNADVNGDLFVTRKGVRKDQETITIQITRAIEDHLGIYMTVHQFRHIAGASYLEDNPEDMETARALLGHAWSKTTRIYVGSSSRRASRAYNRFVFEKREAVRLKRKRRRTRKPKETPPCAS
jgi:integrase